MTLYGDVVSIAATTSGVSGTITVPMGARLLGLNIACAGATLLSSVEIKWTGLQTPIKFVPNIVYCLGANGSGVGTCKTPMIDLRKLPPVSNTNTVTVTVTSTGSYTVEVGLMWVA